MISPLNAISTHIATFASNSRKSSVAFRSNIEKKNNSPRRCDELCGVEQLDLYFVDCTQDCNVGYRQ